MSPFAHICKERRKKLGLSQEEFSAKIGLGLRFIREVEQGRTSLQLSKLNELLFALGYSCGPIAINKPSTNHAL